MLHYLHANVITRRRKRRDTMPLDIIWSLILIGAAALTIAGLTIG